MLLLSSPDSRARRLQPAPDSRAASRTCSLSGIGCVFISCFFTVRGGWPRVNREIRRRSRFFSRGPPAPAGRNGLANRSDRPETPAIPGVLRRPCHTLARSLPSTPQDRPGAAAVLGGQFFGGFGLGVILTPNLFSLGIWPFATLGHFDLKLGLFARPAVFKWGSF